MAGRSFKPASYLASAAQAPNRSPRPNFTRSSSNSSTVSTTSEDSVLVSLRGLKVGDKGDGGVSTTTSSGLNNPTKSDSSSSFTSNNNYPDTPGRKRSQPIAIELPHKEQIYTPLSARGDLPGGYFPNYEEVPKIYRSHPFGDPKTKAQVQADSPIMSASSSLMSSPSSESTPRGPHTGFMSPAFGPLSPSIPEPLVKPMGKYHPANYKSPANTRVSTPTGNSRLLPPTNLSIPMPNKRHVSNTRPTHGHIRQNSDVKRKIQQYQRDMIAQARSSASVSITSAMNGSKKEPISPRLLPAGSPGPITPFELEDLDGANDGDGYIAAGHRIRTKLDEQERRLDLDRDRQETMSALERVRS